MPVFSIPDLTVSKYSDGTPVRAGDTVVPCIFVDSNGQMSSFRGEPVSIDDMLVPAVSAEYAVTQTTRSYQFSRSHGTVTDDSSGLLKVYLVVTLHNATTTFLHGLISSFSTGYSVVEITDYVRDTPVQLDTLALSSSSVYDSETSAFREIKEADSVYAHIVAMDPRGLFVSQSVFVNPVADWTPPTGLGGVTLGNVTANSIIVTNLNSIVDGGDGVSSITIHYGTSSTFGAGTEMATFAPSLVGLHHQWH